MSIKKIDDIAISSLREVEGILFSCIDEIETILVSILASRRSDEYFTLNLSEIAELIRDREELICFDCGIIKTALERVVVPYIDVLVDKGIIMKKAVAGRFVYRSYVPKRNKVKNGPSLVLNGQLSLIV